MLVGIYLRVNFAPLIVQDPQDASYLDSYCPKFPQDQKINRKNIEKGIFLGKITGGPSKEKGEHYQIFGVTRRVTRLAKWGPGFGGECELFCSFAQILPPPP